MFGFICNFLKTDSALPTGFPMRMGALVALVFGLASLGHAEELLGKLPERDPIEGIWQGTIAAPQGTVAEIGLEFLRTKRGTLVFKLNFPDMATYGVAFMIPVESDGHSHYKITPNFDLSLSLADDRLTGTFGLARLPLELKRGGEFPPKPLPRSYPSGPAPLWKFELGSGTWAPPVVSDETIYIGTTAGQFHAVHARDGTRSWTWTGANGIDARATIGPKSVYVVDTKMNLLALDRDRGLLQWSVPLHDEKIAGKPAPDNPTFNHRAATPLLLDGVVYCGSSDGGLYAIDANTGTKLWRHDAKAPVYSGIGVSAENTLMFGTMDGSVVLLDKRNQKETLRVKTSGGVVTTPVIAGGRLIVGSRDYEIHAFDLTEGRAAWNYSYWFSWIESTPAIVDGLVYFGASDYARVTVLEPATGKTVWSTPVGGMNWGTPLVTTHRVFTGTVAQAIEGTVIAHAGGIVAINRESGKIEWVLPAPPAPANAFGGYAGSLALAGDKVIAAGFDGYLIALPIE